MIAALDMYDFPEIREATDAWWATLAKAFRAEGLGDVPERLTHSADESRSWSAPNLFLAQICGYPLRKFHKDRLTVIGTPCYRAEGADGPSYRSAVIVRKGADIRTLSDLKGRRFTYNGRDSQSGMSAFRAYLAEAGCRPDFLGATIESGSHRRSIAMIASGAADIAAIDCVTLALLRRHAPEECTAISILGWTPEAPGLPYVVPASTGSDRIAALRRGIAAALSDPSAETARDTLLIDDFAPLSDGEYAAIDRMEVRAAENGLPSLFLSC